MFALLPVNIRLALRSLSRNRLRTLLTMLGIIIGVAAVLTMVALGTGARSAVEGEVSAAGTRLVFVRSGNYTRGGESIGILSGLGSARTLMPADADAIKASIPQVDTVSRGVTLRDTLNAGTQRSFARVQGVEPGYERAYGWELVQGRMVGDDAAEAVIGQTLAGQLFVSSGDPVGQSVTLRGTAFTVVGITSGVSEDHAEVLFVPWQRLQALRGGTHLDTIIVAAGKAGEASLVADAVRTLLRKRHAGSAGSSSGGGSSGGGSSGGGIVSAPPGQSVQSGSVDDFTVETQAAKALTQGLYTPAAAFALANLPKLDEVTLEEMADTLDRASDTMTALLASIAGVSLIVGGIGIMNIMLVSVTERTREVGLRVAAGARASDIAMQFLIEAMTLSLIGGLLGLVLGLAAAWTIGWSLGWPAQVSAAAMAMAVGISAAVGLVFGIYPARRAAQLNPIDALRSE